MMIRCHFCGKEITGLAEQRLYVGKSAVCRVCGAIIRPPKPLVPMTRDDAIWLENELALDEKTFVDGYPQGRK